MSQTHCCIYRITGDLYSHLGHQQFPPKGTTGYATRFRRRIRSVLAPNGSSSNAPAIIVEASGTALTLTLSMNAVSSFPLTPVAVNANVLFPLGNEIFIDRAVKS